MTARAFNDDPVLAAMAAAVSVPFTEHERTLLSEVDLSAPRLSHDAVMQQVAARHDTDAE